MSRALTPATGSKDNTITKSNWMQVLERMEKMRRVTIMISLSVLLAAVGLTACGGNGSPTGQPRIQFDEYYYVDVGNVSPGVPLDYSFHFTNEGDAPLKIDDVKIQVIEGC